jgi:hypothetical protein
MILRLLPFCAAGVLLAGCAAGPGSSLGAAAGQENVVHGYLYHDGNHSGGASLPSPQANYNANHGTWLWPPQEGDKPN